MASGDLEHSADSFMADCLERLRKVPLGQVKESIPIANDGADPAKSRAIKHASPAPRPTLLRDDH
jgi:hypothetical protein